MHKSLIATPPSTGHSSIELDWPTLVDKLCTRDTDGRISLKSELPPDLRERSWSIDFSSAGSPSPLADWIGISSSGTTGPAKLFWRSQQQLMLEAAAVSNAFELGDVAEIVSFAPANHAFGFLCGIATAYLHKAAYVQMPLLKPHLLEERLHGSRIVLTLTASWQVLPRLPRLCRKASRIVHSAGPVPDFARTFLSTRRDQLSKVCEIFGSAETGGLAFRRGASRGDAVWQLFDDVALRYSSWDCSWQVFSPRIALRQAQGMINTETKCPALLESEIEIVDDRKIRIFGRRDMTIKVNGINVSLSKLAESLGISLPDCPLALISERDPIRGESFSIVMRSSSAPLASRQLNEQLVTAEVQRLYGPNVYPVRYAYSDTIERTASGKNKIILYGNSPLDASMHGRANDQI